MTRIALFGGTGRTGRRVLRRALRMGHTVRALVRDPAKLELELEHERLTVVQGDVLDPAAVAQTLEGTEVVLSLFGQVKGSSRTLQADGTRIITEAMARLGIDRIVTLSGGGLRAVDKDAPKPADRVIRALLRVLAGHVLADAEAHLDVLQASGLDWTVVRGPAAHRGGRHRVVPRGLGRGEREHQHQQGRPGGLHPDAGRRPQPRASAAVRQPLMRGR